MAMLGQWFKRLLQTAALSAALSALPTQALVIAVLGDSLSAGYGLAPEQSWVSLMAAELPEHTVVNAAISGDTTGNGLARLEQVLNDSEPDLLILELGANDALRGLPVAHIKSNLQRIIIESKTAGADVVVLGIKIPSNYGPRYNQQFEKIFSDLAKQHQLPLVPFFLEAIALDPHHFQADQVHPTVEAQPLILQTVLPTIKQAIAAREAK